MIARGNLLGGIPERLATERFDLLLERPGCRIERIVSIGHATPPGEWYDQVEDEWVVVLAGAARLIIDGEPEPVVLHTGDYVLLPAHVRHRVDWTDPTAPTVWLALHTPADAASGRRPEAK